MNYNFDKIIDRTGTYTMKYDDSDYFRRIAPSIRLDQDTIRLLLADMDFQCAPAITEAMHRVADFSTFGYTTADAAPEYRMAICSWYQKRYNFELKPEWIVHSNGALDGVGQAISTFSDQGDGIIVCCPVYSNFSSTIRRLKRQVVNCQMMQPRLGHYEIDWDAFEATCVEPKNKVFILCSPENPVGRVWTESELCRMAAICRQHDVILVSDEIHSDIVRSGVRHHPVLQAVDDHSNLIMVSGVNKSFNLMGLQCAYTVIADADLRNRFVQDYHTEAPTPFAIAAVIAAYNESEDWLNALNAYLDMLVVDTVQYIAQKLPKAKAYVPEGTYILWVDFSGYKLPGKTLQYLVNHKANVAVQGGLSHDPQCGETYLRLCLTSPRSVIFEAIDRIAAAFEAYEKETEA